MPSNRGLPRDWSKSEISEKLSLRSGSAISASARFINSVSDLYAADEIDALLDEIRDLEPISVHTDDLQDFEIDGSVTRLAYAYDMTCDSRNSVHSWDSHALYTNSRMEDAEIRGGSVSMYCDSNHFKTPIGILRIILIVTSLVSLGCLLYSGTALYGIFMLPYIARIRLMIFVNLFTLLLTLLLLFLDISLVYTAFPFHYHRMAIAVYTMECAAFMGASALILQLVYIYKESFPWISKVTRDQLIASSVFGFLAGIVALGLAGFGMWEMCRLHFPKREDTDQLTLTERAAQNATSSPSNANTLINMNATCPGGPSVQVSSSTVQVTPGTGSGLSGGKSQKSQKSHTPFSTIVGHAAAAHIPGPVATEPLVTTTVWPIDDVQPCSSKHMQSTSTNTGNNNSRHSTSSQTQTR